MIEHLPQITASAIGLGYTQLTRPQQEAPQACQIHLCLFFGSDPPLYTQAMSDTQTSTAPLAQPPHSDHQDRTQPEETDSALQLATIRANDAQRHLFGAPPPTYHDPYDPTGHTDLEATQALIDAATTKGDKDTIEK